MSESATTCEVRRYELPIGGTFELAPGERLAAVLDTVRSMLGSGAWWLTIYVLVETP